MPGKPIPESQRIDKLIERFAVLATEIDDLLPAWYRFNSEASTGDLRRDAWANADTKCIVMTGAALTELEAVLRTDAIERAKPRGRAGKYTKVEPDGDAPDERIGTPMYADE